MAGISTMGLYLNQLSALKNQQTTIGDLSAQIASGRKTQKLSGLGSDALRTVQARAGVNTMTTYVDNIKNANRRIQLMTSSLTEIKSQAEKIASSLTTSVQEGDYPDFDVMQSLAGNVYEFIMDAMNQMDGERYLFGGGDTSTKPITDTGLYDSFLGEFVPDSTDVTNPPLVASGMIGKWGDGTVTTDEFIASYHGVSDTVLGYSNALTTGTTGKSTVRVSDKAEFDYTTLGNIPALRDIVVSLGVLKSLPPVASAPGALNDPTQTIPAEDINPTPPAEKQENFFKVINDLQKTVTTAIDNIDKQLFKLSQTQAQITTVMDSHTTQINTYKDVIGDAENTDITEASVKITQLQVQIQASFQVTAMLSQLSLANFLGG